MQDKSLFIASLIAFFLYFLFLTALFTPLRNILSPFVNVIIIVYLFLPCIKWLRKHNIKGTFATLVIYFIVLSVGIFAALCAIPKIIDATHAIFNLVSGYVPGRVINDIKTSFFNGGFTRAYYALSTATKSSLNIIVSFVAAFYILSDVDSIKNVMKEFVPTKLIPSFRIIIDDVKLSFDSFFKGQLLVAFLLFLIDGVFLYALKIPHSWGLALVAAVLDIVPYAGAFIAMGIIVIVTLVSAPGKLIWVIVGILVIQQVENNVITPKVSSDTLSLHPAVTVLALYLGAYGGFWGILLAIPLTCVFRQLFVRLIQSIL